MSRSLIAAAVALSLTAPSLDAQTFEVPRASPRTQVDERIGLTDVSYSYSRPSMRGREIFGALVPYGEIWRTGANAATTISFSNDVTFGGEDVPAGSYALFTIPSETEWTVILNATAQQWGSYAYDASVDVARMKVPVHTLREPVETFAIGLTDMDAEAAHLTLEWETTRVSVPIEVDVAAILVPQIEAAMAGDGDDRPFFEAAMFYYSHDVDIAKAVEWIEEAARQQPDAMWVVYRKGLVLAKAGDTEGALEAARASREMARAAGGELGEEYERLSDALIDELTSES